MANKKATIKVFVYGTLKVGGFYAESFNRVRVNHQLARLRGFSLYNLGWFPGIIEDEAGTVVGELHEYSYPEEVLPAFDRIEGYSAANEQDSLYLRRKAVVELEDGSEVEAIVYIFNTTNMKPKNSMKIEDGVWKL